MTAGAIALLRRRAGTLLVWAASALLAVSLLSAGAGMLRSDRVEADAQPDRQVADLENGLRTARSALEALRGRILAGLPGGDVARIARDKSAGRSVLLEVTDLAQRREAAQAQAMLQARYRFMAPPSPTLTEFVPQWATATRSTQGTGTAYAVAGLDVDVSGVQGSRYEYVGTARFDPVAGGVPAEYVLFGFSTAADGSVSSFQACLASSRTRDEFAAAGKRNSGDTHAPVSTTEARPAPPHGG